MLTRQLVALQRAGLDVLNVSLDTLRPSRYEQVTRRKGWERVMAGIDLALQLGYNSVKVKIVSYVLDFEKNENKPNYIFQELSTWYLQQTYLQ